MSGGEIRDTFQNLTQVVSTKDQAITTQPKAMIDQANGEVAPRVNQNPSTMACRLRDFTRMNPHMFFGSKVNEDPPDFLDEVYMILYAMELSSNNKGRASCLPTRGFVSNLIHSMERQ